MPAYLDHAASTPVRPEVADAVLPFLGDLYGNPTASHAWGRAARRALDDARDDLADALGARPGQIVFTSGGTEADNQAISGVLAARGGVAVCSAIEHHAVLEPVARSGGRVVPVDAHGVVDLDALADALGPDVAVVSVMAANNEIGVLQPLADVVALVRERAPGALVHTDAVAAFPWVDVAVLAADVDLVSISAHKLGGLKGAGALVVRPEGAVAPLLRGGGQERDRRSGTPNIVGAVALATAARITHDTRKATADEVAAQRDRLADGLLAAVGDVTETAVVDGDRSGKVAGSVHLCFDGVESEALLFLLDRAGVAASAAASCASGAMDPSHVLAALGYDRARAGGSLRLSLGWSTTDADIDLALEAVPAAVAQLRSTGGAAR